VRRLVLYEPSVHEPALQPELVGRMQGLLAANRREEVVLLTMREVVLMPEEEIAAMRRLPSWPTRVAAAHTLPRELSVPLHWDPAEAARVTAPTLVLVGGDSPPFVQAEARLVAAALPDCRVAVVDGQQHVADQFVPDLFARLVLDFLLGPARH
jgi:pimeloyl-ACP methyl ester carboxylesterase